MIEALLDVATNAAHSCESPSIDRKMMAVVKALDERFPLYPDEEKPRVMALVWLSLEGGAGE